MRNAKFLSESELCDLGFASLGDNVRIHSTVVLIGCERMAIGDNVRIDPFCILSAGKHINIGSYNHIAGHCTLAGSGPIELEDFVGVSHGSKILSSTDDFSGPFLTGPTVPAQFTNVHSELVRMGKHVVVGANCLVLPGAEIGEGATIGALSLVKGDIAPWTVCAGAPAKVISRRDSAGVLAAEARLFDTE